MITSSSPVTTVLDSSNNERQTGLPIEEEENLALLTRPPNNNPPHISTPSNTNSLYSGGSLSAGRATVQTSAGIQESTRIAVLNGGPNGQYPTGGTISQQPGAIRVPAPQAIPQMIPIQPLHQLQHMQQFYHQPQNSQSQHPQYTHPHGMITAMSSQKLTHGSSVHSIHSQSHPPNFQPMIRHRPILPATAANTATNSNGDNNLNTHPQTSMPYPSGVSSNTMPHLYYYTNGNLIPVQHPQSGNASAINMAMGQEERDQLWAAIFDLQHRVGYLEHVLMLQRHVKRGQQQHRSKNSPQNMTHQAMNVEVGLGESLVNESSSKHPKFDPSQLRDNRFFGQSYKLPERETFAPITSITENKTVPVNEVLQHKVMEGKSSSLLDDGEQLVTLGNAATLQLQQDQLDSNQPPIVTLIPDGIQSPMINTQMLIPPTSMLTTTSNNMLSPPHSAQQTFEMVSKEVDLRAAIDRECFQVLRMTANPDKPTLNRIVSSLLSTCYSNTAPCSGGNSTSTFTLTRKHLTKRVREFFRKRREYMNSRIDTACARHFSDLRIDSPEAETLILAFLEQPGSGSAFLDQIRQRAQVDIENIQTARIFVMQRVKQWVRRARSLYEQYMPCSSISNTSTMTTSNAHNNGSLMGSSVHSGSIQTFLQNIVMLGMNGVSDNCVNGTM